MCHFPPPAEKSKLQVIHQNKSRWHTSTVRLYCFIFSSSTHLSFEAFPVSTSILGVFSIPRCLFLLGPSGNPVLQCSSTVKRLGHRQSLAVSSREGWVFLQAKKKKQAAGFTKNFPMIYTTRSWTARAREKGWLDGYFHFRKVSFHGRTVKLQVGIVWINHPPPRMPVTWINF